MSITKKAAKEGFWLAGFRFLTQGFSWVITIMIARILVPEDYGLIAMASILTGYVEMFSELGLGAAIVQRETISQEDLSSIFWFSLFIGIIFTLLGLGLAYPTAWLFNDLRIVPITQLISVLFIIGGLGTVPHHLLSREIRFKEIGAIKLLAVIVASLSMLLMAYKGFGVWALALGYIIQISLKVLLSFLISRWRPKFHFQIREVKSFLKYGLNVAGSRSLLYLSRKIDIFVVGKVFNAKLLGYYSFAMQLATIPNEKIIRIIQQVAFPVVSRYQHDLARCQELYLKITKYVALIVIPLFLGGAFWGEEIINALLGEKWAQITFLFQILCVAQLIFSIAVINNVFNNAMGRPHFVLVFQLINAIVMPISIYIAARFGFNALVIPWLTVFPIVNAIWTLISLKRMEISLLKYLKCFVTPFLGTLFMIIGVFCIQSLSDYVLSLSREFMIILVQDIIFGAIFYFTYLSFFERKSLYEIKSLRNS
jgi:O-antigen/teichoic acid export membrane protein